MHLSSIELKNIRLFRELKWDIGAKPGWNVVIGDNGSGKTAFLRAISAALVGRQNALQLRQNWGDWLADKQERAHISIEADFAQKSAGIFLRTLAIIPLGAQSATLVTVPSLRAHLTAGEVKQFTEKFMKQIEVNMQTFHAELFLQGYHASIEPPDDLNSILFDTQFSAGFGSSRKFTGGDKDLEHIFRTSPDLARHLSLFGENIALNEALKWLQKLRFKELEEKSDSSLLHNLCGFINQDGFLPHGLRMDRITSEDVKFIDANGFKLPVTSLSDGFRSILSFAFELIHQISNHFGHENLFERDDGKIIVKHAGVILVDEIDAHMHPTWQRRIGFWLTEHFPQIQFIVSTHSPLVCQAAENGSIFRLAAPGTDEPSKEVVGVDRDRLIFGSVLDAYGTELFGNDISRSRTGQIKQERLAELNQKAFFGSLSSDEKIEREKLLAVFPANF